MHVRVRASTSASKHGSCVPSRRARAFNSSPADVQSSHGPQCLAHGAAAPFRAELNKTHRAAPNAQRLTYT
eukprot:8251449-Alexandrium_andersonii.AAC.1